MVSIKLYKLRLLLEKFTLRERYLMLIAMSALIIALTQGILIVSGLAKHDVINSRIEQYKNEAATFKSALTQLESSAKSPRVITLQSSNQQLESTLNELDGRINRISSLIMTPNQMAAVLTQLITQQRGLSLLRFNVLPAEPLQTNIDIATVFYRHTIEITLTGELDTFTKYLIDIEKLTEQVFWDDLTVIHQQLPPHEFKLRVHTLSREKEWLTF